MDHDVEVVGWGADPRTGEKYWHIRNSWGTFWGENGFFKLPRGSNSMQIESNCAMALVDVRELDDRLAGKTRGSMFGLLRPHPTPTTPRPDPTPITPRPHLTPATPRPSPTPTTP